VRLILDYRAATKLKSTYVDTLPGYVVPGTGRIHTTFGQLATATGRLVSSNPNLQNIPIRSEQGQEIRKAFVPRDKDHRLVSADYSQIELRIMAELSGDAAMIEAFKSGQDIHAATASRVHRVALDDVTPEMRRQAKMINYGLMYGMSVFGLSQRLGVPRKDAGEIVDQYFNEFSGIRTYIDDTIAFARDAGYVQTMCGRRRYLPDIDSRNQTIRGAAERNAVNSPIQGSGADLIKVAMIHIHDAFREAGLRSVMVLQIHDELLFDAVKDEVEDVKRIVTDKMVNAVPMRVPIEVDIGVGENWLEAH
jgi:DNA polymerase-1